MKFQQSKRNRQKSDITNERQILAQRDYNQNEDWMTNYFQKSLSEIKINQENKQFNFQQSKKSQENLNIQDFNETFNFKASLQKNHDSLNFSNIHLSSNQKKQDVSAEFQKLRTPEHLLKTSSNFEKIIPNLYEYESKKEQLINYDDKIKQISMNIIRKNKFELSDQKKLCDSSQSPKKPNNFCFSNKKQQNLIQDIAAAKKIQQFFRNIQRNKQNSRTQDQTIRNLFFDFEPQVNLKVTKKPPKNTKQVPYVQKPLQQIQISEENYRDSINEITNQSREQLMQQPTNKSFKESIKSFEKENYSFNMNNPLNQSKQVKLKYSSKPIDAKKVRQIDLDQMYIIISKLEQENIDLKDQMQNIIEQKLLSQKEEMAIVISKYQIFMDKLIADKQQLSVKLENCEKKEIQDLDAIKSLNLQLQQLHLIRNQDQEKFLNLKEEYNLQNNKYFQILNENKLLQGKVHQLNDDLTKSKNDDIYNEYKILKQMLDKEIDQNLQNSYLEKQNKDLQLEIQSLRLKITNENLPKKTKQNIEEIIKKNEQLNKIIENLDQELKKKNQEINDKKYNYDDVKTIEKLKCQIATMEKNKAFNFNVNIEQKLQEQDELILKLQDQLNQKDQSLYQQQQKYLNLQKDHQQDISDIQNEQTRNFLRFQKKKVKETIQKKDECIKKLNDLLYNQQSYNSNSTIEFES